MGSSSLPVPTVHRPIGGRHKLRKARGFSLGELKEAGLYQSQARSIGISADERRSTVHAHNVATLKAFLSLAKTDTTSSKAEQVTEEPEVKEEAVSDKTKKVSRSKTVRAKKRTT